MRLVRAATPGGVPELSRLPKAPKLRSLRFKRTTPGAPMQLVNGHQNAIQINPHHPLARIRGQKFSQMIPRFHGPTFMLSVYPHALLRPWDKIPQMTTARQKGVSTELNEALAQAHERYRGGKPPSTPSRGDKRRKAHSLPMSLIPFTPLTLHSKGFIRSKLRSKIREAVRLVVIRGAKACSESSGKIVLGTPKGIEYNTPEADLILQGWLYVFRPKLELYRRPWKDVIKEVRAALEDVREKGIRLTDQWSNKDIPIQQQNTDKTVGNLGTECQPGSQQIIRNKFPSKSLDFRARQPNEKSPRLRTSAPRNTSSVPSCATSQPKSVHQNMRGSKIRGKSESDNQK